MDNTDNRLAYILLTLCSTPAASHGVLAERLRVSERTVSNHMKQLEGELKDCATIRSSQGKYTLHIFDAERFRAVRARILAEESGFNSPGGRMDYVFGRLVRSQVPLLTDELAYEMNMGRSTLVSDLKPHPTAPRRRPGEDGADGVRVCVCEVGNVQVCVFNSSGVLIR